MGLLIDEKIDFSLNISTENFEELNAGFFMKCMERVENCLRDGPRVKQILLGFFDGKPLSRVG